MPSFEEFPLSVNHCEREKGGILLAFSGLGFAGGKGRGSHVPETASGLFTEHFLLRQRQNSLEPDFLEHGTYAE
jgi:hypothetical protein